ncbi:MAG: hypothetical protein AAF639_19440 [Chloroflexota bacterium]
MTQDTHTGNKDQSDPLQPFNTDTMSGITPGTKTRVFYKIQLAAIDMPSASTWGRVSLSDDERVYALHLPETQLDTWKEDALCVLTGDSPIDLTELEGNLPQMGWQLRSCGSCQHWKKEGSLPNEGRCHYVVQSTEDNNIETPTSEAAQSFLTSPFTHQSYLGLACAQWLQKDDRTDESHDDTDCVIDSQEEDSQPEATSVSLKHRIQRRLTRLLRHKKPKTETSDWLARIIENNPVVSETSSAGTEPCLACHGRIVNLGALTVDSITDENVDDKHTLSVWRCRHCHTFYLNSWVDRWERVKSLETEEWYYRLNPAETLAVLTTIHSVQGGAHPAQRDQRTAQRQWFIEFLQDREPLSHQVKHGR